MLSLDLSVSGWSGPSTHPLPVGQEFLEEPERLMTVAGASDVIPGPERVQVACSQCRGTALTGNRTPAGGVPRVPICVIFTAWHESGGPRLPDCP